MEVGLKHIADYKSLYSMRPDCKSGRAELVVAAKVNDDGLKGQRANSPRQRLGCQKSAPIALKGQKHFEYNKAYALSGRLYVDILTQGDAQGFNLIGLTGRMQNTGRKLWQHRC